MYRGIIEREVCEKYGTSIYVLRSKRFLRKGDICNARNELCYKFYTLLHMSTKEIGTYMGLTYMTVSRNIKRHCDIHKLKDPMTDKATVFLDRIVDKLIFLNDRKSIRELVIEAHDIGYSRGHASGRRKREKDLLSTYMNTPIPDYLEQI